jgi:DmsE family decaheme c-type cytochrome
MVLGKLMLGLLCGLAAALGSSAAQAQLAPAYAEQGASTCMKCHDKPPVTHILETEHAVMGDKRTPFAQHGCESCHGASPQHLVKPPEGQKRAPPTVVFAGPYASPVETRNGVCMTCHQGGLRMNWQGSQHQMNDVACVNCHTAHAQQDLVRVKLSQPAVCFTCHNEQRAQSFQFSHHPIREGKVVCGDCHNPHGSPGTKMLREVRVTDTCFRCHAEKRGPFLWEHPPVREDCMTCHTPHGSTQARLLRERMPYLCQNCHGGAGGHNGPPFAGQNLPGRNNTLAANRSLQVPQFQINTKSCLNCHSVVHGSNSPGGLYFTR